MLILLTLKNLRLSIDLKVFIYMIQSFLEYTVDWALTTLFDFNVLSQVFALDWVWLS